MIAALTGGAPILVLAPHPDDESLGCGALLAAAFAATGAHVACLTDGAASHPGSTLWPPARLACLRRAELDAAIACLGGTPADVTWCGGPDGALEATPALVARIAALATRLGARHLFAPAAEDGHRDHRATLAIARAALHPGQRLFTYPVWGRADDPLFDARLDTTPWRRLDTAPWRHAKRAAIEAHASQRGRVVADSPGFAMTDAFVALFADRDEAFCEAAPAAAVSA